MLLLGKLLTALRFMSWRSLFCRRCLWAKIEGNRRFFTILYVDSICAGRVIFCYVFI